MGQPEPRRPSDLAKPGRRGCARCRHIQHCAPLLKAPIVRFSRKPSLRPPSHLIPPLNPYPPCLQTGSGPQDLPFGLAKMIQFGIQNAILECDLAAPYINWNK